MLGSRIMISLRPLHWLEWEFQNTTSVSEILVAVKKHSSGEEDMWEHQVSNHQIGGWRAASAAGLQDKGSRKRSLFRDSGIVIIISIIIIIIIIIISSSSSSSTSSSSSSSSSSSHARRRLAQEEAVAEAVEVQHSALGGGGPVAV